MSILTGPVDPGASNVGWVPELSFEFGGGRVAKVDIDFLSGPTRTGVFTPPSGAIAADKVEFGASRRARWFGL